MIVMYFGILLLVPMQTYIADRFYNDWQMNQNVVIMLSSFVVAVACYEICRRFRVTRFLFGIKGQQTLRK